jgi:hypothetical protein
MVSPKGLVKISADKRNDTRPKKKAAEAAFSRPQKKS